MTFLLHPQLAKDCLPVGDLNVCRVLLMNNRHFPWLILVPRREGVRELFDLNVPEYASVMAELRIVAAQFAAYTRAHKINIAALGNRVPQLHIHVVARFEGDAAWPNPVWNCGIAPVSYSLQTGTEKISEIRAALHV